MSTGQMTPTWRNQYWKEVTRPLTSLAFVLPLLLIYEVGLVFLGPQAMRNGADVWLRQFLDMVGFSQYFLLPILTCGILLGWHHVRHDHWRIRSGTLYGMLFESVAFGFVLLAIGHVQHTLILQISGGVKCAVGPPAFGFGHVVAYLGAGVYEELLFRLMLLPVFVTVCRVCGCTPKLSLFLGVLSNSLVFSAAHYQLDLVVGDLHLQTLTGDLFTWPSFLFRFTAGVFFSVLFTYRGFGIAVGSHALYDIFVTAL